MSVPKDRPMPSASAVQTTVRSRGRVRALLLGGTAICGALATTAPRPATAANILPTQGTTNLALQAGGSINVKTLQAGVVTPGTVNFNSTGAAATVNLTAP